MNNSREQVRERFEARFGNGFVSVILKMSTSEETRIFGEEALLSFIEEEIQRAEKEWGDVAGLKDTLGVLEMAGRKTIKIEDVRYYLTPHPKGEDKE